MLNALTLYRLGRWCLAHRIPVVPHLAYRAIYLFCRAVVPLSAEIGEGVEFAYGGLGIVLHERCRIGKYVTVGHDVTIGERSRRWGVPMVGDRCVIGAGAKLLGPINVGEQAVIGANAVVVDDVPPNSVVVGVPARVTRRGIDIHEYSCLQPPEEADRVSFRTSNNLVMTVIEDPGRLSRLTPEWADLLEHSEADCLFLTGEWMTTWWRHFAREAWTLNVVTIRRHDRLLGLAPLFSRPARFGGLVPWRSTEFLATGIVGSDYLDVVARRGEEEAVARALAEYAGRRRPVLTLSHVRESCEAEELARILEQEGWALYRSPVELCPYIPLRGRDWESYLASLGSSHRYNFQRRLKNLHKQGTLTFEAVEKEDQRGEAVKHLFALHDQRWDERGGSQAMQSERERAFHDSFSRLALERDWLRLYLLRMNGRPIGALYGFRRGRRFYFYQSGFDPAWKQQSVGLVTMGLSIQRALAEGVEEFDLLHGTESYKFLWTRDQRRLKRILLFPPSWKGDLLRRAWELEASGKRVARTYLPDSALDRIVARRRTEV